AENLLPLAVAVLDSGGHLVAFKREDGCGLLRAEIAQGKARGALGMGIPSRTIAQRLSNRPNFVTAVVAASGGEFVPVPRGVLLPPARAGRADGPRRHRRGPARQGRIRRAPGGARGGADAGPRRAEPGVEGERLVAVGPLPSRDGADERTVLGSRDDPDPARAPPLEFLRRLLDQRPGRRRRPLVGSVPVRSARGLFLARRAVLRPLRGARHHGRAALPGH